MVGKPLTVLVYIAFGLLIALWPIIVQWVMLSDSRLCRAITARTQSRTTSVTWGTRLAWPLGLGIGLLAGSTLVWWRARFADISMLEAGIYAIVVVIAASILTMGNRQNALHRPARFRWLLVILTVSVCLLLSFTTGIMQQPAVMLTTWHHWSAFIGPSELMISGARIFHDFPAQYGLGATTLIAAACGDNCSLGMHYVVAITSLLFGLAVLYVVASLQTRSLLVTAVLFAIVVFVCFFWDAYPPMVSSPREAPSVSGLRFLPAIALVIVLITIERSPFLTARWSRVGHAFYVIGALWSPESLFFVTYVWWPYYIWRRLSASPRASAPMVMARAALTLILVLAVVVTGFAGIYRLSYGVFPSASAYLAYMLYPPGELPIDPGGPVWFSATALVLGLVLVTRLLVTRENGPPLHRSLLVMLLAYATLSYCMGRGHSNNFLNLLPFTTMILTCVFGSGLAMFPRAISAGMLVSLLGWTSAFGWGAWASTIESRSLFEFRPHEFVSAFAYERPDSAAAVVDHFKQATGIEDFANISTALAEIRATSKDPISVIDGNYLLLADAKPEAWSAYHGPGNVYFMPREWRQRFMRNTRDRLNRSGWLIISDRFAPEWLEDFRSFYQTTESKSFGSYRAIHFSPRK